MGSNLKQGERRAKNALQSGIQRTKYATEKPAFPVHGNADIPARPAALHCVRMTRRGTTGPLRTGLSVHQSDFQFERAFLLVSETFPSEEQSEAALLAYVSSNRSELPTLLRKEADK